MQGNRCPVKEATDLYELTVDQDAMVLRHIQIRMWHVGRERRPRDANWKHSGYPRLRNITPGVSIAADPLNRLYSTEMRRQEISDSERLDGALACRRPDPRSL